MDIKIACIGSNLESERVLEDLSREGLDVALLITLPEKQREGVSDYVDLHQFCKEKKIEVIDTENVNSSETIQSLKNLELDYLFTLGWSQLFSNDLISCFSKMVIGSHPSDLPEGRGRAPVAWTILQQLKQSAISFFAIDEGVDSGKIILKRHFEIPPRSYAVDVYNLIADNLAAGFVDIYHQILSGSTIDLTEQDESKATYRAKRVPADGLLDFANASPDQVDALVRAVSYPFPGAYSFYRDEKITIWKSDVYKGKWVFGTFGQILKRENNKLLVQAKGGGVWLSDFTDDNGKMIPLSCFQVGSKFGYNVEDEIYQLKRVLARHNIK